MMPEPPPSFSPGRKWNLTLNTAVLLFSLLALLTMANYLTARHYLRFAWAQTAQAEISPRTRQVLASVTNEVRVILYFDPDHPLFKMSHSLLKAYATANPRVVLEVIDYTRDNSAALAAKRKYNLNEKNDHDLIIFDCQTRTKHVFQSELSDLDLNELLAGRGGEVRRIAFKGEMLFTSAILTVITPRQLKAYFLEGHGEHSPENDDGLTGYSRFAGVLAENSVKFERLQIEGALRIPGDCNLLIIAGPRQLLSPAALEKIDGYLKQGGRLLALFNINTAARDTGLENTLSGWGVAVGRNVVFDEDYAESANKMDMVISRFSPHRLSVPLIGSGLYLIAPRSIDRDKTADRGSDAPQVDVLAQTSPGGRISRINPDGSIPPRSIDDPSPRSVSLMVAVERGGVRNVSAERGATRIVVTGDSFFLANASIEKLANHEFASHAINWLLAREELLVPIPPRPIKEYKLTLSDAQMTALQWILMAALPGAALVLGGLVWLRRRR
ncbi:MAG: gliding motility-associatede transport system auxiliary component [Verrucomicrobiota bacterium]|jgi:hypothetical protein